MALGGGVFLTQNKVLPGAYINFVSLSRANATLSERGYATMPLELDWGVDDKVFEVTTSDFQKNSLKIFGYDYTDVKLKGLRDLFKNITTLYAYRLNGGGNKAANDFATALCTGVRGNNLKIQIQKNADDDSKFDVTTILGVAKIDKQTVTKASELKSNAFVEFKSEATLSETAATPLTGGTNGTVTGASHQAYLDKIESYTFNTLGVPVTDVTTKKLYAAFCKRLRDEVGAKFQVVLYNMAADYEGVINVKNKVEGDNPADLVYWVTGVSAGCPVNKSNLNKIYDGEFEIDTKFTQSQLIKAIQDGEFTLHQVNDKVRVLSDVNSLVSVTEEKSADFKENQAIRVMDQIANDIARLFVNKYLGEIPNDKGGRVSLWTDIVKHHEQLQRIRAIEDFKDTDVVVEQGASKRAVVINDTVRIVGMMAQLYMTVVVA